MILVHWELLTGRMESGESEQFSAVATGHMFAAGQDRLLLLGKEACSMLQLSLDMARFSTLEICPVSTADMLIA